MTRLAPLLLLAGCSTANLDCTDLSQGACKVQFTRVLTDVGASLTGPHGLSMTYSSNPNAAATQEAFTAINRLAGLVGTVAGARLGVPLPLVPGQAPAAEDSDADDASWVRDGRRAQPMSQISASSDAAKWDMPRSCPMLATPRRVTPGGPWMVEGLAQAAEV